MDDYFEALLWHSHARGAIRTQSREWKLPWPFMKGQGTSQSEPGWAEIARANQKESPTVFGITTCQLKFWTQDRKSTSLWEDANVYDSHARGHAVKCVWLRHGLHFLQQSEKTQSNWVFVVPESPSVLWNEFGWTIRRKIECLILMTEELQGYFGILAGNEGQNQQSGGLFRASHHGIAEVKFLNESCYPWKPQNPRESLYLILKFKLIWKLELNHV